MATQQNLDLLTRLGYLQAGGQDVGQRDVDKLSTLGQNIGGIGKTIMDYLKDKETLDSAAVQRELNKQKIAKEKLEMTPISTYGVGDTPTQTQSKLNQAFNAPIEESPDDRIKRLGQEIESRTQEAKLGQIPSSDYKDIINAEYLRSVTPAKKELIESQTEKNLRPNQIYTANDLTPKAKTLYLSTKGASLSDTLSKEELNNYEKQIRAQELSGRAQTNSFKNSVRFIQGQLEDDQELKEFKKQNISLSQMNNLIDSVKNGNTVAASGMGVKMAKSMGEVGVMTDKDVIRYVTSGQLTQGAADKLSRWLIGKPTDATLDEISQIANVLNSQYTEKVQPIYDKYADRLSALEGLSRDESYRYLAIKDENKPKKETIKSAKDPLGLGL